MRCSRVNLLLVLVDAIALASVIGLVYTFQLLCLDDLRNSHPLSSVGSLAGLKYIIRSTLVCGPWRVRDRGLPGPECIRLAKIIVNQDGTISWISKRFLIANPSFPPYRALSYTWGPAKGKLEDADPVFRYQHRGAEESIPMNLLRALGRIGELNENEWYWIDSICIDQSLARERSEQVSNMHNIYQQAIAVDVWLGDATDHEVADTTRILRDLAEQGRRKSRMRDESPQDISFRRSIPVTPEHILPEEEWHILIPFFSLRWFHRVWTLQKFSLAKSVRILYGKGFINADMLGDAVSFLTSHSMHVELEYGNNDTAGIAVHQRFLMREYLSDIQQLTRFLPPFIPCQGLIDYEIVLALVFWHSAATFATDPRDYVYGITGVANAVMDRLMGDKDFIAARKCATYQPFHTDYAVTTAEVYKQFIVRLMEGSVGIRAITLMQRNTHSAESEHRRRGRTLPSWTDSGNELPSWVPNLSDRQHVPLSAGKALGSYDDATFHSPNVLRHPHLTTKQKFHISGNSLHVFGKRIGTVANKSSELPSSVDVESCVEFALNIIKVLHMLPEKHCSTNNTPIQGLLASLGLGREESEAVMNDDRTLVPKPQTVEGLIAHGLSTLVCIHMGRSKYASIDTLLTNDNLVHSAREIPGLSPGFLVEEIENWRNPARQFVWREFFECIMQTNVLPDIAYTCGELVTYFKKANGQSVFALAMDETHHSRLCPQGKSGGRNSRMFIGLGPNSMQAGDEIWVLRGSEWPFVLRPRYLEQDRGSRVTEKSHRVRKRAWWQIPLLKCAVVDAYELIGEAYVHGIMDGELFQNDDIGDNLDEIVIR
ncbi:heterokaryon incompatibility protein-domain-containing protein [Xylaria venustula]|nr:heterokaryon incompatibility protein-domain-containing protein [Xylaria venustula]